MRRAARQLVCCGVIAAACARVPIDLSAPLGAAQSFQRAVAAHRWDIAARCLSEEIRENNRASLGRPELYTTWYWTESRGMESLRLFDDGGPPVVEPDATFALVNGDADHAELEVSYPASHEKYVRLATLHLERNAAGEWRIAELFERTARVGVSPSSLPAPR